MKIKDIKLVGIDPSLVPLAEKPGETTMHDLLVGAENLWRYKKKDAAFNALIAAMRLLSQGMAQNMNDIKELKDKK